MRWVALLLLVSVLALSGCGSGDAPAPPRTAVTLTLDTPADLDVVRGRSVEVSGSVRPAGASVLVRGQRVTVSDGRFSTEVGLAAGTNVIDVLAGARGERAAMAAVRVRRQVTVRVPDLSGDGAREAHDRLAGLGLRADDVDASGPFDGLLPGHPQVCQTDPEAGRTIDAGRTVRLFLAKDC
jgi:hypothetical protein